MSRLRSSLLVVAVAVSALVGVVGQAAAAGNTTLTYLSSVNGCTNPAPVLDGNEATYCELTTDSVPSLTLRMSQGTDLVRQVRIKASYAWEVQLRDSAGVIVQTAAQQTGASLGSGGSWLTYDFGSGVTAEQIRLQSKTVSVGGKTRLYEVEVDSGPVPVPVTVAPVVSGQQVGTGQDVSLSWAPVADADTYEVERGGVSLASGLTSTSYVDAVGAYGSFQYRVRGVNELGPGPWSVVATVSVIEPAPDVAPVLTVTAGVEDSLLQWNSVLHATGYRVYRDGTPIETVYVAPLEYHAVNLVGGVSYRWTVVPFNATGDGPASAPVDAVAVAPPDTTAPNPPSGLEIVPGNGQVLVRFEGSSSLDVTGYRLTYGGTTVDLGLTKSYLVTGLTNGADVTVSVVAYDAAGNVSAAATVTGTPVDMNDPSRYGQLVRFSVNHSAGLIDTVSVGFKALAPWGLGLMIVVAGLFWLIGVARRFIGSAS